MKYCVLFPRAQNIHLIKDVGMIAYKFNKLFGYNAFIACYNNDNYDYVNSYVKGLKLEFIEKKYKSGMLNEIRFLKNNSKNIDILQIFHITLSSFVYIFFYKFFNKNGKIFLKLDCTKELIEKLKSANFFMKAIVIGFLKKTTIIGVEQELLYSKLTEVIPQLKNKFKVIPNGVDFDLIDKFESNSKFKKENIVINVSRIGSPEKNIHILMEAFLKFSKAATEHWKLVLVGPIEEEFNNFIKSFFRMHPEVEDTVVFKGPIYDRGQLFNEYKRSKIYCCSSAYESFGISMLEAAAFGNVIVSSKTGIAEELTEGGCGVLVEKITAEELAEGLLKYENSEALDSISFKILERCRRKFAWNDIVSKLKESLEN